MDHDDFRIFGAFLAAAILLVLCVWAIQEFKSESDLLNCVSAGHRNCQ